MSAEDKETVPKEEMKEGGKNNDTIPRYIITATNDLPSEDQDFVQWKIETLKEIEKELREAEPAGVEPGGVEPGGLEPGAGSAPPADWAPAPPDSSHEQGGLLEPVPQPDVVPAEAEAGAPPVLGSEASVPQEAGAAAPAQPAPLDTLAPPSPPAPPLPPLPPAPLTEHLAEAAAEAAAEAVIYIPASAPTGPKCTGAIKKVPTNKQLLKAKGKPKRRHQSGGMMGHGGSTSGGHGGRGAGPQSRGSGPAGGRGAGRGYGAGYGAGSATPRRE